jgi:hypothetical protein
MPAGPAVEVDTDDAPVSSCAETSRGLAGRFEEYALEGETPPKLATISVAPPVGRRSTAASSAANVVTESQVRELAAYGIPATDMVGSVRYFFRVRKRRLELLEEQRRLGVELIASQGHKRKLLSRLGQEAFRLGVCPTGLAASIDQAVEASREYAALTSKSAGLAAEHKTRVEQLERERASIDELCRPAREAEAEVKADLEQLGRSKRGIEVHKKRAEIELRNLEEAIAAKQLSFADPHKSRDEKDVLLRGIAALDNQRPALLARFKKQEEELLAFSGPIASAQLRLAEVRGTLAVKLEQIAAIDAEINRMTERFSTAEGMASKDFDRAVENSDELWSAVGLRLLEDKVASSALADIRGLVVASGAQVDACLNRRMLVDRAVNAYDHSAFDNGKKMLLAAGAVIALVLGLGIFGLTL